MFLVFFLYVIPKYNVSKNILIDFIKLLTYFLFPAIFFSSCFYGEILWKLHFALNRNFASSQKTYKPVN